MLTTLHRPGQTQHRPLYDSHCRQSVTLPTRTISSISALLFCFSFAVTAPTTAEAGWLESLKQKGEELLDNAIDKVGSTKEKQQEPNQTESEPQPSVPSAPAKTNAPQTSPYPAGQVREVQQLLTDLGYKPGPVDGAYGAGTAKAIQDYQASHGLPQTGAPSTELVAHLRNIRAAQVAATPGPAVQSPGMEPSQKTAPIPVTNVGGSEATAPTTAPSVVARTASEAGLRVLHGWPLVIGSGWAGIAKSEGIVDDEQFAAIGRFFDHIRLGINPGLGTSSTCFANLLLTPAEKSQVLRAKLQKKITPNRPVEIKKTGYQEFWKGQNEFEVQDAENLFNSDILPKLIERAPTLPLQFVYVDRISLRPYDQSKQGFPFSSKLEVTLPPSRCLNKSGDYLPVATPLPQIWSLDPGSAREVANRIPVLENTRPGKEIQRKVFAAVKYTLSAAPESPINQHGAPRVPMKIDIESVDLYEDPNLERHLHTFRIDNPAPAVLLAGIPESLPQSRQTVLDGETVTLMLLKQHGDVLGRAAWEALARHHARNDAEYYDKKVTRVGAGGAHRVATLETYDPGYVPFFPRGVGVRHGHGLTDEQLPIFKKWSLKRAARLPDRFTMRGQIVRDRKSGELEWTLGQIGSPRGNSKLAAKMTALGFAPGQLVHPDLDNRKLGVNFDHRNLMGSGKQRVPLLVLANLMKAYPPGISAEQLEKLNGRKVGYYPLEMDLLIERAELVAVDSQQEAFLLHAQPLAMRALNTDASASLHEQTYQVVTLEQGQISTSELDVEVPSNEKMPLSAEVADLMIARYLPETLDEANVTRMLLARWHYENSFNNNSEEPQWGRFFIEGKPKPDAKQRAELRPRFKEWTLQRAKAMPGVVTAAFNNNRIRKPGSLKLGTGVGPDLNTMKRYLSGCESHARRAKQNNPELAQSHENACTFLEEAATIPGREIYIGRGSVQRLLKSRRLKPKPNVSIYGTGLGPRWVCNQGPDPYCRGMLEEFGSRGELFGQTPALDDALVIDKEIHVPDDRPDIIGRSPSDIIVEIDIEITGVRRTNQMPVHPFVAAYKAYNEFLQQIDFKTQSTSGRWVEEFDQETVPLFLFDAHVKEARLVDQRANEPLAKLDLREPRQPDYALLEIVEPERVAAPGEPYGPDVVGLRLGMSFEEADKIIRGHMKVGRSRIADRAWQTKAATGKLDPFTSGRFYESQDGNELIIIFDEPPAAPNTVLGFVRQVSFPKGKVAPTTLYAQLEKKYGAASSPDSSGSGQIWFEESTKNNRFSRSCSPSYNTSAPHDIWRDSNAGAEEPELVPLTRPTPPVFTGNKSGADDQGAAQEYLKQQQEHLKKQREYMTAVKKQQQERQQRYSTRLPGLDCRGCQDLSRAAECPAGLAATFETRGNNKWDRLIIQVFDYRVYVQQFSESKRLIDKGESNFLPTNTDIDLDL